MLYDAAYFALSTFITLSLAQMISWITTTKEKLRRSLEITNGFVTYELTANYMTLPKETIAAFKSPFNCSRPQDIEQSREVNL